MTGQPTPHAPHVVTLEADQAFVAVPEMRDIADIEVATADPTTNAGVQPVRLAVVTKPHFDLVRRNRAGERGMPKMVARAAHGLHLFPQPDKPYWLRVTYRAPVKRETRDPEGQP